MDDDKTIPIPDRRRTPTRRGAPTRRAGDEAPILELQAWVEPVIRVLIQEALREGNTALVAIGTQNGRYNDLDQKLESTANQLGRQYQEALSEVVELRKRVSAFESEMDTVGERMQAFSAHADRAKINLDKLIDLSDSIEFVAEAIAQARRGKGGRPR